MLIYHEKISYAVTIRKSKASGYGQGIDHWHQRVEMIYVVEGKCQIRSSGQRMLCEAGDLVVVRSGEIHAIEGDTERQLYVVTFDPTIFYRFTPEASFPKRFISAREQQQAGVDKEIARLLEEIFQEDLRQEPLFETFMRAGILRLYSILLRHFEDVSSKDDKNYIRLQQLQSALEYIASHYAEPITLAEVATAIGYTPSYVSTLFVSKIGLNFKTYLDNIRINKAADLLGSTRLTVADVAAQCGFDNVRTFNNTFRRVVGQSPSQFRKSIV